jgi:hypothetical protein
MKSVPFNQKKQTILAYVSKLEDDAEVDRLLRIISSDLSENELYGLTDEHLAIVNQRREMHLAGESNSFSLEEVIISARNSILK